MPAVLRAGLLVLVGCGRVGFEQVGDGSSADTGAATRILFVRAANGTVGYLNGGTDTNACDINDEASPLGWAKLRNALTAGGFSLDQRTENASTGADLAGLDAYSIVVFGSNNFAYGAGHADVVEAYVRAGGAALFISDAGFGLTSYAPGADSDSALLVRFDLQMTEDANDVLAFGAGRFAAPSHPVLAGIASIKADGTSALRILNGVADVTPTLLVRKMPDDVRIGGVIMPATANDAAVVVAQVGAGRVAGLFDRDTIGNSNPDAGIEMGDNRNLAINLFEWLAGQR